MFMIRGNLRNKVKLGYFVCLIWIIVIALGSYFALNNINKRFTFRMFIEDFFNATLEMRRYEKNYIIYHLEDDYVQADMYAEAAATILMHNRERIAETFHADIARVENDLMEYRRMLGQYAALDRNVSTTEALMLEIKFRNLGREIVTFGERIAKDEKENILSTIHRSKQALLWMVALTIICVAFLAQYIAKAVVSPLKQLEINMRNIAMGRFDRLTGSASDEEVLSLLNAFSRIMQELNEKQNAFINQSQKLASLGTMISSIAHQINNPLSNIYSSSQILREELETSGQCPQLRVLAQQIESETERAKALTTTLLDFSRKREFKAEAVRIAPIVEETVGFLRGETPSGVDVRIDVPDDLWLPLDKQHMQHALLNIVKNAIDAVGASGAITITALRDEDRQCILIKIQDTGHGIEPESLECVFDPFYTTKKGRQGTGLGLYVSREIVQEHGGTIDVASAPGEGTVFTIMLPVKKI